MAPIQTHAGPRGPFRLVGSGRAELRQTPTPWMPPRDTATFEGGRAAAGWCSFAMWVRVGNPGPSSGVATGS